MDTETYRKAWNKRQTECRQMLTSSDNHLEAIRFFLSQHAQLHTAEVSQTEPWSFEDDLLEGMSEEGIRRIPHNEEHSVAWTLWHIARIEDVAMNLLVAETPQIFHQGQWLERLKINIHHTGNAMDPESVADLSASIDIEALRAYRLAVGRSTREMVMKLQPEELRAKVDPARAAQVRAEGAVVEAADGIVDYWSKRNIAGLLLMPASRHNFLHLNEAMRIKRRRR